MCIALAGGVDGCDKFSGWQQAMEMEREIVIPPQKKRWWYKVTKNPMVVFFFQIVYPHKNPTFWQKMVTAVHPFVPCATKATSSIDSQYWNGHRCMVYGFWGCRSSTAQDRTYWQQGPSHLLCGQQSEPKPWDVSKWCMLVGFPWALDDGNFARKNKFLHVSYVLITGV